MAGIPELGSTGANPVPALAGVILEACHRSKDRSPKTLSKHLNEGWKVGCVTNSNEIEYCYISTKIE